jgi:hypothetical protein
MGHWILFWPHRDTHHHCAVKHHHCGYAHHHCAVNHHQCKFYAYYNIDQKKMDNQYQENLYYKLFL